jgi:hypothetical protein
MFLCQAKRIEVTTAGRAPYEGSIWDTWGDTLQAQGAKLLSHK